MSRCSINQQGGDCNGSEEEGREEAGSQEEGREEEEVTEVLWEPGCKSPGSFFHIPPHAGKDA
jgi:hypothetical protein